MFKKMPKKFLILTLSLMCVVILNGKSPSAAAEELGNSQSILSGIFGRSCDTDYPLHGVYDATVLFGIDEQRVGDVFLDMDADRNTLEYRTNAYDFFEGRYGIVFDPTMPGQQFISDGQGGVAFVWPLKLGDGPTHQVYAIDAQEYVVLRHRIPITNIALWNDGFFVFALTDFRVHGSYGGLEGAVVRGGDLLAYGQYRMMDDLGHLIDTWTFQGDTPTLLTPFTGDPSTSNGSTIVAINAINQSELLGQGRVRGIGEISPLPDGSTRLDFRYVLRVPNKLEDATMNHPVCRNIPPFIIRLLQYF